MMDNKDIDYLTEEFDEMSTSDLVMWLENHRDTDETCKKMYWDMEYVCKKWVKEIGESCIEPDNQATLTLTNQATLNIYLIIMLVFSHLTFIWEK